MITINYQVPGKCSICGHEITITHFTCNQCKTKTEGTFDSCRFCRLSPEQLEFVEVFLRCRGNIKDVEKELGLSYPTIRNRLEDALQALGIQRPPQHNIASVTDKKEYSKVLEALAKGEVSPQEALKEIKSRK